MKNGSSAETCHSNCKKAAFHLIDRVQPVMAKEDGTRGFADKCTIELWAIKLVKLLAFARLPFIPRGRAFEFEANKAPKRQFRPGLIRMDGIYRKLGNLGPDGFFGKVKIWVSIDAMSQRLEERSKGYYGHHYCHHPWKVSLGVEQVQALV